MTQKEQTDSILELKLDRDLLNAAGTLGLHEARYVVDAYYNSQELRIAISARIRSMKNQPSGVLEWWMEKSELLELQIQRALKHFAESNYMARWALGVCGIGPVLASGLVVHIDITQCPTAGHIWSFAGLNPNQQWLGKERAKDLVGQVVNGKAKITEHCLLKLAELTHRNPSIVSKACAGMPKEDVIAWFAKRPWNASLKTLCWKIGESFVKVSGNPASQYGQLYKQRKALEELRNEKGLYSEQAQAKALKVGRKTDAYKFYSKGKLPPGHIHARAKRYAVKIFLSHWHMEAYRHHFRKEPPLPYPIAHLGHTHLIEPLWPGEPRHQSESERQSRPSLQE